MQTSQLRDTLLDGQCDTDSLRRSLHGFVEHGGIQVCLEVKVLYTALVLSGHPVRT